MSIEKLPLKSKKFIALFFIVVVLAVIMGITLFTQTIGWPLAVFAALIVITIGTLGTGYILGQAGLDKYIAIANTTIDKSSRGEKDAKSDSENN
jgi:tetrahydromethanopterin S-methyltransferase subunit E